MTSSTNSDSRPTIIRHISSGTTCCVPEWEAAYERFETPEQEIQKFIHRLTRFGFPSLPKSSRIAEIFCGRGNGLVALERMGFDNLEGVDLSESLLERYCGPAALHLADCLDLPLESDSYDIVIVQGGLHHLPKIPEDLDQTLAHAKRILKPEGTFYAVEPWPTPFLTLVHLIVERRLVRAVYPKGDALAEMTEYERETYEQWLGQPDRILQVFNDHFEPRTLRTRWGKLVYAGSPRK
jgi:ubiquinone/menaquinone biosynthesis C-methylase UbiE